MRFLIIFLLAFPLVCFAATVYTKTDKKGNITYSDTPLDNSQLIVVPEVNSTSSSSKPTSTMVESQKTTQNANEDIKKEIKKPYTVFSINSPRDQDTFQNQRVIPITIKLDPELQKGDRIQLIVDGKPYGAAQESSNLQVEQLERGTHVISAQLISNNQVVKQSNAITIFIHYANLGTNKP